MEQFTKQPIRLAPNRIFRGYPGGREILRFRGMPDGPDDLRPEAWVGSTTLTIDHARHPGNRLGHAHAVLDNGDCPYLKDLIEADPEGFLGKSHVSRFGPEPFILVKLLDAEKQLGLQCHPDRAFAKAHFNSDFGKVECWYVLGVRDDTAEPPYLLLGFKEGITREAFEALYHAGEISAMERWCHKIPAKVGDMYHVGAGVPHAIGPGCFVIEVQEPSDITVGAHPRQTGDLKADRAFDERALGSYHYDGRSYECNMSTWLVSPTVLRSESGGMEIRLLGKEQTSYFGVTRLHVTEALKHRETGTFSIAIVTRGSGCLINEGGALSVRQGQEVFLPAGMKGAQWVLEGKGDIVCESEGIMTEARPYLEIVCCYPPEII